MGNKFFSYGKNILLSRIYFSVGPEEEIFQVLLRFSYKKGFTSDVQLIFLFFDNWLMYVAIPKK